MNLAFRWGVAAAGIACYALGTGRVEAQPDAAAEPDAAVDPDAGAPAPPPTVVPSAGSVADAGAPPGYGTCVERVPEGKPPPRLSDRFEKRGTSGHAVTLTVVVEHGKGESVLPGGLTLGAAPDGLAKLEKQHFIVPDPDGGVAPTLESEPSGDQVKTTLTIPLVPLPLEAGRHTLTLPPLPIAVSRASGQIVTLCTRPHEIVVEDPIANDPDPSPLENPPPRRQREEWLLAKQVAVGALVALVVGALLAWLISRLRRRPKKGPPPPPPRPPWEVALEELFDLRQARLIEEERYGEHFDRLSDTVRKYLGGRYGFDGLESTTREVLATLRAVEPPIAVLSQIEGFLREADLVKFARVTPSVTACEQADMLAEEVVRRTIPAAEPAEEISETADAAEGGGT
jgi:hypothetical protein